MTDISLVEYLSLAATSFRAEAKRSFTVTHLPQPSLSRRQGPEVLSSYGAVLAKGV